MAALAAFLDAALGELRNSHRGASAPDSPIEGQRWWDTSGGATAEILKRYTVAGGWVSLLTMNVTAGTITAIHGILDENDMTSDSAVLPPSQQSVKAYVDAKKISGDVVQVVNTIVSTVATGTTAIPFDDSIPQKTEGTEYMTLAITPKNAANKLIIQVSCYLSNSNNNQSPTVALFQDDTADALAAAVHVHTTGNQMGHIHLTHYMVAGTTSATTFKVRGGSGVGATTTFNGYSGTRIFGGVSASSITITEIAA
jgi:hypothetical protein